MVCEVSGSGFIVEVGGAIVAVVEARSSEGVDDDVSAGGFEFHAYLCAYVMRGATRVEAWRGAAVVEAQGAMKLKSTAGQVLEICWCWACRP